MKKNRIPAILITFAWVSNSALSQDGVEIRVPPGAQLPNFEVIVGKNNPQLIDNYNAFILLAGQVSALDRRPDTSADDYFNGRFGTQGESYAATVLLLDEFMRYRESLEKEGFEKVCERFQNEGNFRSIDFIDALNEADEEKKRMAVAYVEENLRVTLGDSRFSILMRELTNIKSSMTIRKTEVTDEMARQVPTDLLLKTYCMG